MNDGTVPYIEGEVMQPIPQIAPPAPASEAVKLLKQQPLRVVDEAGELLHGGHTVGGRGDALLLGVHGLARLGKDVRIYNQVLIPWTQRFDVDLAP